MESSALGPGAPAGGDSTPSKRERARQITTIALVVLVAVFALLNLRQVKVNFIVTTTKAPLIIVIVACLAVGLVIGLFAGRRRSGD